MTRVILLLFLILAVGAILLAAPRGRACARASGPAPPGARGGGPPASVKMLPCPVCGTYVVPGKAISVVSGGAPVYFCSEKCRAEYQPR